MQSCPPNRAAQLACLVAVALVVLLPSANAQGALLSYNPKNVALPEVCKGKGDTAPGDLGKDINGCKIRGVGTPSTPTVLKFSITQPPDFDILITLRFRSGEGMLNFVVPRSDLLSSDPNFQAYVSSPRDVATLYIQREIFEGFFRSFPNQFSDFEFEIATTSLSSDFIVTVFTPSKKKRVDPKDEAVLKQLYSRCCPEGRDTTPLCGTLADATNATRTLDQDICNTPPNMCNEQNRLLRLHMYPNPARQEPPLQCKGGKLPLDLFSQLTGLDYLDFDRNGLAADMADVAEALGKLPDLETLYLSENELTGKLDCRLIKGHMQRLWLEGNNIQGTIPACFLSSQTLTTLALSGNRLTGPMPRINGTISLVNLFINSQQGGYDLESLPPNLEEATSLQGLYARANGFTGPLPKLPASIVNLVLGFNQFSGSIPASYTKLQALQRLSLSGNKLTGDIPAGLITLPELSFLDLSNNGLTGGLTKLPWDKATVGLGWVDFSNNSLTGPLPAFPLSDTSNFSVNTLLLSNNQLTGTLDAFASTILPVDRSINPGGMPAYGNYYYRVALNNNLFTGRVPGNLAKMLMWEETDATTFSNVLDLSGNQLSGPFPLWLYGKILQALKVTRIFVSTTGNKLECPGMGDVTPEILAVQVAYNFTCYLPAADAYVPVAEVLAGLYAPGSSSFPRSLGPPDSSSSSTTSRSSSSTSSSLAPSPKSSSSSLSTPALIGICVGAVVGGAILIVLAIVVAYKVMGKRKAARSKQYADFDKAEGSMQMQPVGPVLTSAPAAVLPTSTSMHGTSTV